MEDNHYTPIMFAASNSSDPSIIDVLVKHGADVNNDDVTPLMLASMLNTQEVVESLIKHGANVNARNGYNQTVLRYATGNSKMPELMTELLIKHGANVNASDQDGYTELMEASRTTSNPAVIEILLKHGADVKARDRDGKTALDYAKENEGFYNTEVYKKMEKLMSK